MFEIGFWELALLFGVGLVILGPEKLPRVAAQIGRYVGQARRMARTLANQIRDELEAEDRRQSQQPRSGTTPPSDPQSDAGPVQPTAWSRPGVADLIPGEAADSRPAGPVTTESSPTRPAADA